MRIYFDEEVVCPICGHEEVSWQVTTEVLKEYSTNELTKRTETGNLIIDTICKNPDCRQYGRIVKQTNNNKN